MPMRFNPAPGWPPPPPGWTPPDGWQPDPSWPPAPPGWSFWVDDTPAPAPAPLPAQPPVQAPPQPPVQAPPPPVQLAAPTAAPTPEAAPLAGEQKKGGLGGLFGGKKQLEEENAQLRSHLQRLGAMDAAQIAAHTEQARQVYAQVQQAIAAANQQLAEVQREVVETRDIALLQEAGVYAYAHPLDNAVAYKDTITKLKADIKATISAGNAVTATTTWQVNGSAAQGRKMVTDFSKLLLRAYNAEADNCVRTVKPHNREATIERLSKAASTIERLGKTMDIRIAEPYHQLRCYEIRVTADYLAKAEQEKEEQRAERERLREEAAALRDFERERARLTKEQAHYAAALARLELSGDTAAAEELRAKLAEIDVEMEKVISREANIRAGYVYVISNVGAFGEEMVKIGMTRRLDPLDRVRELGDASVPFKFDVHALIFSEDAVGLENKLHTALASKRVNRINLRREFFRATPTEVRDVLAGLAGNHLLEYTDTAEASEWRASLGLAASEQTAAGVGAPGSGG